MQKKEREFSPGFRLNLTDIHILVCGSGLAFFLRETESELSILTLTVVLHFFLFCNVFRIKRKKELIWMFVFLLLVAFTVILGRPSFTVSIAISIAVSSYLIIKEIKEVDYHGIFWHRLNPNLRLWWDEQIKA